MIVTLIRGFIVYVVLIFSVRLMGKRQIGQLQPADLVIALLISEIAAIPIENPSAPLLNSINSILLLVSIEILISYWSMKSTSIRRLLQGNSVLIIENGTINQRALKQMRLTVDDLTESLRQKDIFDIGEVSFAYAETNGTISAELFPDKKPVTAMQMNIQAQDSGIPVVIISDGKVVNENFAHCFLNEHTLPKVLKNQGVKQQDILIMTADTEKVCTIIKREEK